MSAADDAEALLQLRWPVSEPGDWSGAVVYVVCRIRRLSVAPVLLGDLTPDSVHATKLSAWQRMTYLDHNGYECEVYVEPLITEDVDPAQ
jgi:hypothetical protein